MSGNEYDPTSHDAMFSRIESKLDQSCQWQLEHEEKDTHRHAEICALVKDSSARITVIERWRYYVLGAAAAVAVFAREGWDWLKLHK